MILLFDVQGEPQAAEAYSVDESDFGACVRTQTVLKPGQILDLQSEDQTVRFHCRVVWTGDVASDREGEAGLEFLLPPSC